MQSNEWPLYIAKIKETKRARNVIYANFFAPNLKAAFEYAQTKYFSNPAYIIDCRMATHTERATIESGESLRW